MSRAAARAEEEDAPSQLLQKRYRGTSLIRNSPPPKDHHRTLGAVLLEGPTRGVFLVSEVPL